MAPSLQSVPFISTYDFPKTEPSWESKGASSQTTTAVASEENSPIVDSQLSEVHGQQLPLPTPTLQQLLSESAKKHFDNIALISMHQAQDVIPIEFPESFQSHVTFKRNYLRWTHGQLQYASEVLASSLRAQGVKKEMPIATLLSNGVEWAMAVRAAAILGCPFVPLNPRIVVNVEEVEHMLKVSGTRVLLTADLPISQKLQDGLPELMGEMVMKTVLGKEHHALPTGWTRFYDLFLAPKLPDSDPLSSTEAAVEDDPSIIIFTSGTTSLPMGVAHTNKSIGSSLQSNVLALKLDQGSRTCCHMPTFHIGGAAIALAFMMAGGSVVFPSAGFDPGASLDAISQEQCTNLPCVPTILQALVGHPKMASTDTSSLRNVEMGATTILPENLKQVFNILKCPSTSNAFAMSEGIPVCLRFFYPNDYKFVSAGTVCPGARIRICAPDSKDPVKRGEPGEIHMGGPQVIKSYLHGASPESFYTDSHGHWIRTGDQAVMSESGEISVSGRYKDIIIRGGENVAPAAIEAVLDTQLGVMAQVVGVRSDEAGEVPIAVVQSKDASAIPTSAIRKSILEVLGTGFVPEKFYTLQDLGLKDYPKTASGKIRKVELKTVVQKHEDSLEAQEAQVNGPHTHVDLESKLAGIWHKIIDADDEQVPLDANFSDFADSLTLMRFRNKIKRDLGFDVNADQLLKAGTIKSLTGLLSSQTTSSAISFLDISREGPPQTDHMAITLGDPDVAAQIQKEVATMIEPLGFSWEEDVEDVIPSWDLAAEVFGSVAGHAKLNHRMIFSMKKATVEELFADVKRVLELHAMQRSFELRGVNGEATMRVIMRPNGRWLKYSVSEIPAVENPEELVSLIHSGQHFAEVGLPYPSSLVRIAHIKSTNSAGMIWAQQHAAFDGLSLFTFLEDLDTLVGNPQVRVKPHIPYKLWADTYYLHRTSHAAQRSIGYHVRKLSELSQHSTALFPPTTPQNASQTRHVLQRQSFKARTLMTGLPHISELKTQHDVPAFIVVKAALALFLSFKTNSPLALFAQNENGRTWPFQDDWMQKQLPQCMDLAGPTVERTIQLTPISAQETVLEFLQRLQKEQEADAPHVHAPWTSVRERLGTENVAVFDAAAERTCLNWLPIRTNNGDVSFTNMQYYPLKTNIEIWNNWNCGIEDKKRLWIQIYGDEDRVRKEDAEEWTECVMSAARWMSDMENWEKRVGSFNF